MAFYDSHTDVYSFADSITVPDEVQSKQYKHHHQRTNTPIVIDNGSWQCRAGWATQAQPDLIFRNLMARIKTRKVDGDCTVVGNEIANVEALRSIIRNQFDRNVVVNFSNQEVILDHLFHTLGLGEEPNIHHPIVMTEPLCTPSYSRNTFSELLFECYGVPAVSYGVDALYSLYNDQEGCISDGLVLSCGYQTTHVIPVLEGRVVPGHAKRINVGGWHVTSYLHRLLQLRYPALQGLLSTSRAQEIVENHCYVSEDYLVDLRDNRLKSCIVQFPFVGEALPVDLAEQTEKDQQRRERARQHLLRMSQRKREEKIRELEEKLERLIHLQQLAAVTDEEEYLIILEDAGFTNLEFVLKEISSIQNALEIERSKLQATVIKLQDGCDSKGVGGAGDEAVDPQWIQTLQLRRKELLDSKKIRLQQKQELSKRRSAASQDRMRIISQLAEENSVKNGKTNEDTFGMDDNDWNVYRAISKSGGREGSDSEKEEAELREVTKLLEKYDPRSVKESSPSLSQASHYQMKLQIELIRAPEVIFQPPVVGVDQCGLSEAMELVINSFPADVQQRLVNSVHITGGNSLYPNIEKRVHNDLMAMRPFQSSFTVKAAVDRQLSGWKGAALWAKEHYNIKDTGWFTSAAYKEHGPDHWKEHVTSNLH